MNGTELKEYISKVVIEIAGEVLGSTNIPPLDAPLQELGIDSLGAVELRNALSQRLGVKLSATTLFDYPTISAIIEYIYEQISGSTSTKKNISDGLSVQLSMSDPIAITGASCQLPGNSDTPEDFWNMLSKAKDCVKEIPLTRFDVDVYYDSDVDMKGKMYVRKGAFLENAEMFDCSFFNLSPAEVTYMDPQQRMMLEVAFNAFYGSGFTKESLQGNPYGVFIGCCNTDWHFLEQQSNPNKSSSYSGPGGSGCLVSNRLSYVFGIRGPSMTIDTACSSSLIAVDSAVHAIKIGYCTGALVGGINLMLSPQLYLAFCKARMLSPHCRCAVFDAAADGYVRGEGAGAVVLMPLVNAESQNHRILGVIRGTGANHNGKSASLTAPNGPVQQECIRLALRQANIGPLDVKYVESHGTGTALGDPIEMGAIVAVYGQDRRVEDPLIVGALKSYIGHLEGSAGIANIIKLLVCIANRAVPPNLHFSTPNPYMSIEDVPLTLPTEVIPLEPGFNKPRIITATSSFGFGGANAHVIIEEYEGNSSTVRGFGSPHKKVAFLFTGQGSQYINMGLELFKTSTVFRDAIIECEEHLKSYLAVELTQVLYPGASGDENVSTFLDQTRYVQPAIFALEYALLKVMESNGITPDIVLGHSLGEYAAAVAAGVLNLKEALYLIVERGRIMHNIDPRGGVMVACRCRQEDANNAINNLKDKVSSVSVSVINGPKNIVLSGIRDQVDLVLQELNVGDKFRVLNTSHAFHSSLVTDTVEPYEKVLQGVQLNSPKIEFISSVTGQKASEELCTPQYWASHITKTVNFCEAINTVVDYGAKILVEIGPKPTLIHIGQQCIQSSGGQKWISLIDANDPKAFSKGLMSVQQGLRGAHDWKRQSFPWTIVTTPLVAELESVSPQHSVSNTTLTIPVQTHLRDHIVANTPLMPGAGFIEAMGAIAFLHYDGTIPSTSVMLKDIEFDRPLIFPSLTIGEDNAAIKTTTLCSSIKNGEVEIKSKSDDDDEEISHARCNASIITSSDPLYLIEPIDLDELRSKICEQVPVGTLYKSLSDAGLNYAAKFQTIREAFRREQEEALCKIQCLLPLQQFEETYRVHPSILDGAFQSASLLLSDVDTSRPMVPATVQEIKLRRIPPGATVWCHVILKKRDARYATFDLRLYCCKGTILASLVDLTVRSIELNQKPSMPKDILWDTCWEDFNEISDSNESDNTGNDVSELIADDVKIDVKASKVLCIRCPNRYNDSLMLANTDKVLLEVDNEACDREQMEKMLQKEDWDTVYYLGALCEDLSAQDCIQDCLILSNVIAELTVPPPQIYVLTVGQTPINNSIDVKPTHAGLLGFLRTARLELENTIGKMVRFGIIDMAEDVLGDFNQILSIVLDTSAKERQLTSYEPEVAIREGVKYVSRLAKSSINCLGHMELSMSSRGALSMLKLKSINNSSRIPPPPGCIEIRVRAVGLNFRDVLNVMGLYPGDPGMPGADCAGIVTAVGDKVTKHKVGDQVYGIAQGCIRSFAITSEHLMSPVPENLTYEEAAALPVVAVTVEFALGDLAKVKKGDRVLIHALSGGIGITAIQYCQRVGAIVYGTCSGGKKAEFVKNLGVEYVTSSRDAKIFAEDMKTFLGDAKIDVVLNCLIDDFIVESLNLLGENGRFMELGKRGIWSKERMATERPDVMYETIAVDEKMEHDPVWFGSMLKRIQALVDEDHLKPLPLCTFDLEDKENGGIAAFRLMQRAQHIGKVIIRLRSCLNATSAAESGVGEHRLTCAQESEKTYVLVGGLGGLGLVIAKTLIEEGARYIVLLSRSGKPSAEAAGGDLWKYLTCENSSCKVIGLQCDISKKMDVLETFKKISEMGLPKIRGIFHLAGVTADALLLDQSRESIDQVFEPKVQGVWNLHQVCEDLDLNKDMDVFVLFSSVAALIGNFGQANYSAANSILDQFAYWRRAQGYTCQSIQWGPWIEQGMAVNIQQHLDKAGIRGITNDIGSGVLMEIMKNRESPVVGVSSIVWSKFLRRYALDSPTFFSSVATAISYTNTGAVDLSTIGKEGLTDILSTIAQAVSGSSEKPTHDTPLMDLGLDSLGAVEFRNSVADKTGVKLPQNLMFENPSVSDIAEYILNRSNGAAVASTDNDQSPSPHDVPIDQWLMSVLIPQERYALYIDAFNSVYPSVKSMCYVDDIPTALEQLGIKEDTDDYERLHVAWDELTESMKKDSGSNTQNAPISRIPHPTEDVQNIVEGLDFDIAALKPPTQPRDVQHVLLTGVTGFVGRVQLSTLIESNPNVYVWCIVRAKSKEHGIERIRAACKEAKYWKESYTEKIMPIIGDFTKPNLGIAPEKFDELCETIDVVYHTGGDVNLLSNYGRLRATNVLCITEIIRLCTTYRVKPLHFASTLGQYPAFFCVFAGKFSDYVVDEKTRPDAKEMADFYPPTRMGYPWSKWACELILCEARKLGLPVYVYRLPNTYVAYSTGYTNKSDYATALMVASIQEGIFPLGAALAPLTPVDTICEMIVGVSMLEKPKHWLYNLIDTRVFGRKELEVWTQELGFWYQGVHVDEFLVAIKRRGPESPVFKFVPLIQFFRKYWFDTDERSDPFPICTDNIFDDLPHMTWPPLREVFKNSVLYSVRMGFFPERSRSIHLDTDVCLKDAQRISGLSQLGPNQDYFTAPCYLLEKSVLQEMKPSFAGKLAMYRTFRQQLVNLMYMEKMETENPAILQETINRPIVIVGLNRSGTTFLQNILANDVTNRTPRYCEMIAPYGHDGKFLHRNLPNDPETWKADSRVKFAQEVLDSQLGLSEEWNSIHAQSAELPEEDFVIMEHCGRSYSICTEFDVPSYRKWLTANDCQEMKNAYSFHKRFLQHLQYQRSADRWVLKMPFHLFTLDALFEEYPDAQIVFMHRDPKETVGSWASLVKNVQQSLLDSVDPAHIGQSELEAMSLMINRAIAFRSSRPDLKDQFLDMQYYDLIADPIATVERIYKHFNIPLGEQNKADMSKFCMENQKLRKKAIKHHYTLQDVSLTEELIEDAFTEYYALGVCQNRKHTSKIE